MNRQPARAAKELSTAARRTTTSSPPAMAAGRPASGRYPVQAAVYDWLLCGLVQLQALHLASRSSMFITWEEHRSKLDSRASMFSSWTVWIR